MRKLLLTIFAIALFGGGAAFAQAQWAGVSLGWPAIQAYYGQENVLGDDLDLRGRVAVSPFFGLGFAVGADVLVDVEQFGDANEFDLYVGGGPSVGVAGGAFFGDISALGGVEYNAQPDLGIFGEFRLGVGFGGAVGTVFPTYGAALGVNFRF